MPSTAKKIVVIDDSEIVRESTKLLLEDHGYDVVLLDTPISASMIVSQQSPVAVLVDVGMASLTGDHVVRAIKRSQRSKAVCVLLYSDRSERELRKVVSECGADGFLPKSLEPQALVSRLESYISEYARRTAT